MADTITYTIGDVRTNPPAIYRPGDTQRTATGVIHILPPPAIKNFTMNGNSLIFSGTNGVPGGTIYVLSSTNAALPLNVWEAVGTNALDANGNFLFTNVIDMNNLQRFYLFKFP